MGTKPFHPSTPPQEVMPTPLLGHRARILLAEREAADGDTFLLADEAEYPC